MKMNSVEKAPVTPGIIERLRSIPAKKRDRLLDERKLQLIDTDCYAFYKNEAAPAMELVRKVLDDNARTVLLAMPMQAGKTGTASCVFYLLRSLIPDLLGVFICANDQTDLRAQNTERLQHIPGLRVLSRTERKTWEAYAGRCTVVFFDESHFGDGVGMTINEFLERNDIKQSEHFLFCGISATPFTAMGALDAEIWANTKNLEASGYNSVGAMLKNKRIVEADELLTPCEFGMAPTVNTESNVYKHLERCALAPFPKGFCLIRMNSENAGILRRHLEATFGQRVYVQDWNMKTKGFSPDSYFRTLKRGRFVVVIVQQKARMGNTIDTSHFEFLYECSRAPSIDTIMQSFIGRACGFGKQNHKAIVYSSKAMAYAYDMLMKSNGDPDRIEEFADFCRENKLRPPKRASFSRRVVEFATVAVAEPVFHGRTKIEKVEREIRSIVEGVGLDWGAGNIRTLSKTYLGPAKRNRSVWNLKKEDRSLFCGVSPGDWSAVIYDDYNKQDREEGLRKFWKGTKVRIVRRTEHPLTVQSSVGPTVNSLHNRLRLTNQ